MKLLKKIWSVIKWLLLSILAIVAILIIAILIQAKIKPDEVPSIFGYKPFIVLSGSMESEIYTGDLAIVKKVDANTLANNDIIAFRDNEGYIVTHRIVEVKYENNEKVFVTKGDNNNTNDSGFVSLGKVEGKYVFKINKLGNVLMTMQKPITLIIVIAFILVVGLMWIFMDNNKLSNEERKELEKLRKEKQQSD